MVADQIARPLDSRPPVVDERVLDAMRRVPRHRFLDEHTAELAYLDRPLPIGHGQTISQPYIVAYMTELLRVAPEHAVLEIGTGCGYQAAVLAELVDHVYTIEIVEALARRAKETLEALEYANVTVRAGDGYQGWREAAPFDRIMVTAAPDHVPSPLVDQLKPGGRMVLPVGKVWSTQQLTLVSRDEAGRVEEQAVMAVGFVPLTRR
jgi:protein-L-isoaspartate(D-aspartate) O-methyltransferase